MALIVLAGGRSLRLGQDKSSVIIAGESLIQRVISRLASLDPEITIVLSQRSNDFPFIAREVKMVFDLHPGAGPLGGIYTGLMSSASFNNVVVACDMPFVNAELLSYMIELCPGSDAVIPMVGDKVEPLHAVYSKNCLNPIEEQLKQGDLNVHHLFPSIKVRYVGQDEIERFDPEHLSFFNINTKNDLEKAEELAHAYR